MGIREDLQWLVTGHRVAAVIAAAVQLGLVDRLGEPHAADDVAAEAGTDPDATRRVLHALATVGILDEAEGRFVVTDFGRPLMSGTPGSLAAQAKVSADPKLWAAWGNLAHTVRTGETSFKALHGVDPWVHRAQHPDHNRDFNQLMSSLSSRVADAVASSYDFSRRSHVVDVGGGEGALVAAVLRANPHLTGGVLDQPHVVSDAPTDLADRWTSTTGSFFEGVPAADCYLLKSILHDWSDDECVEILSRCRDSLATGGVVLVVELVLDRPGHERDAAFMDINMMVVLGGRERTQAQFAALFDRAGLRLTRTFDTGTPQTLLEAVAAD